MGDFEQQTCYIQAFQEPLLTNIKTQLQMQFLDHHPSKPHKLAHIHAAARYLLQSLDSTIPVTYQPIIVTPVKAEGSTPMIPGHITVKTETFMSVMADFTKTMVETLSQANCSKVSGPTAQRNTNCNFCGGEHFIHECKLVDEYCMVGKVRRNHEGKVILSKGAFCPRDIPGTLLRERVDEWHHHNPNQLSVQNLIHTILAEHVQTHSGTPTTPAFQLSATDRIMALEAELFNLCARRSAFVPVARTRAQKAREQPTEASIEEVADEEGNQSCEKTPEAPSAQPQHLPAIPEPVITITAPQSEEPVHPYHLAKDATYTPPTSWNIGTVPKVLFTKANAPAYKTLPLVHKAAIADHVYQRSMDAPITITQRKLLSLSPEVHTKVREVTTTKHILNPNAFSMQASLQMLNDGDDDMYKIMPAFTLGQQTALEGATIIPDPIDTYYKSLEPGEIPDRDRLTVAKESTAIRSIHALVDTNQKKECTVDLGCQVIAMSETTCHSLSLAYDPRIHLNMESANGSFDWSLGLARNVPFLIGIITLYLQVHVICSPLYEVLLGHPFDILTESVIHNFTNEDQTITITDPNTGRKCTIPTFARRPNCAHNHGLQDF